jgi:inosine/xanthosine triphosphatase
MIIVVGSANPVKINAVVAAIAGTPLAASEVHGFEVASGVPAQPWGNSETRQGALNRAQAALLQGNHHFPQSSDQTLAVGFEGGVQEFDGQVWSTVWCSVLDGSGQHFEANGAMFRIPEPIATKMRAGGELGPIVDELTKDSQVSRKGGAIGLVTSAFVTRTEEYTGIAKMALGLWYGRDWQAGLPVTAHTSAS